MRASLVGRWALPPRARDQVHHAGADAGRSVTVAAAPPKPKATAAPARVVESSKYDVSSAKQTSSAAADSLGGRKISGKRAAWSRRPWGPP
ncbi:MAG: hypothetical protein HOO96_03655 [Polyangiaceae bacterium]|nr:hypothetical protein [Polyangiaceae bacterium]